MKTSFRQFSYFLGGISVVFAVAASLARFGALPVPAQAQTAASDGIAVRIMPNTANLSALAWYRANVPAERQGSPAQLSVDGYPAVRDGRSVYVSAGNVSNQTLYTNIYILSHTQDANADTLDIFGQLLDNWTFNTNLIADPGAGTCFERATNKDTGTACYNDLQCGRGQNEYCSSVKAKVTRDVIRLGHQAEMQAALQRYKDAHGGQAPALAAGTYLAGKTISVWPSWQETLGKELEVTLPTDPLNRLWNCASPNNDGTCWNEKDKVFTGGDIPVNPPTSGYVYSYSSAGVTIPRETSYPVYAPEP